MGRGFYKLASECDWMSKLNCKQKVLKVSGILAKTCKQRGFR